MSDDGLQYASHLLNTVYLERLSLTVVIYLFLAQTKDITTGFLTYSNLPYSGCFMPMHALFGNIQSGSITMYD